jgi:hypothetical protein
MNYATLFQTIQAYCENDFPDTVVVNTSAANVDFLSKSQIDTFIQQAELRIYNTVQFPSLRKNVTGNVTIGNKYLSAPNDFLAVYSIAVINGNDYLYLLNKDVNFIREAYPSVASSDYGLPQYYALFGPTTTNSGSIVITNELSFILGPTPNLEYNIELHYYYYPESITTANTSWLGDNFDTVLLYGSLLEAYTFMKGESDVNNNYIARYNEALAQAKRLGDGMERGDAYRNGQYRQKVV